MNSPTPEAALKNLINNFVERRGASSSSIEIEKEFRSRYGYAHKPVWDELNDNGSVLKHWIEQSMEELAAAQTNAVQVAEALVPEAVVADVSYKTYVPVSAPLPQVPPPDALLNHPDVEVRYKEDKPEEVANIFAEFCENCHNRVPTRDANQNRVSFCPACCADLRDVVLYWTASGGLTEDGEVLLAQSGLILDESSDVDEVDENAPVVAAPDLLPLVPSVMKVYCNWVTYCPGTKDKTPFISGFTTRKASSKNPKTWVDYQTACANIAAGKGFKGLGFVTDGARTGNLTGIDIDGCIQDGKIAEWAQAILNFLGPTYTEITVSGCGLRAWVVATIPANKKCLMALEPHSNGKDQAVEVFSDALYFTVSGNKLPEVPSDVVSLDESRTAEFFALLDSKKVVREGDKSHQSKIVRTRPVSHPDGTLTFEAIPPDAGFKHLFDAVGWKPLQDRMNKMEDVRFHGITIAPGKMSLCPLPYGRHADRTGSNWSACFGEMSSQQGVVHCFGCDFSGDVVKAVRVFDEGEYGGNIKYATMYDVARKICQEEGLNFEDFFPQPKASASAPAATPAESLKFTRMNEVARKKLEWFWQNRIPSGKLTTLAGDPDQGKSLITLYLASVLSVGGTFFGDDTPIEPGETLFLAAEDDVADTLAPRLDAAGADLSKIIQVTSAMVIDGPGKTLRERQVQLDVDVVKIYKMIRNNPKIKLIIIDPISSFLGLANMNKEQEVRGTLEPLRRVAANTGVTVVLVAHFNKNSEARSAIDRVGGAKALVGLSRAAWTCLPVPNETLDNEASTQEPDQKQFLKLKGNLAPSNVGGLTYVISARPVEVEGLDGPEMVDQPYIEWTGKTENKAQDVLINGETTGRGEKTDATKKWLRSYIEESGGAAKREEIIWDGDDQKYSKRTLERAKNELGLSGKKYGSDWYWVSPGFDDSQLTLEGKPTIKKKHGGSRSGSGRKGKTEKAPIYIRVKDQPTEESVVTTPRPEVGGECIKCQQHFSTTDDFRKHDCSGQLSKLA